jgi:FkbM family methyltransferase
MLRSMLRIAERAAAALIAATPARDFILRHGALAPIAWKTPFFYRALTAIATRGPRTAMIETNMGVEGNLRLTFPVAKYYLAFARPDQHPSERSTLELARIFTRRGSPFLDVGANEGLFTFFVAADAMATKRADIHVFEPDADLFARLDANLRRNGIAATVNNIAVSNRTGRQTFYRNLDDDYSGSLTDYFTAGHETRAVDMETTSLADYLVARDLRHVCVKVDVEGAGPAVWEGALGARERIDWLIMEIIGPDYEADLPRRIIEETGWGAWYIRDFELVPSLAGEFEYRTPFYNWLFTRNDPAALATVLRESRFTVLEPETARSIS